MDAPTVVLRKDPMVLMTRFGRHGVCMLCVHMCGTISCSRQKIPKHRLEQIFLIIKMAVL